MSNFPTTTTQRTFWERPEGKTGLIFLIGGIIGGGWLLYKALPFFITLMENTLHAMFLMAAIGAIVYVALDPKFRTLVSTMYQLAMRWLTGIVVTIDPIAIMKNYVDDLKKNLSKMNDQLSNLKGRMKELQNVIQQNERERVNNVKLMGEAQKQGKREALMLKSRKVGRLQDSNMTLQALYTKMETLYRVLNKMYESAGFLIEDIEDQVDVKERERKSLLAGYGAFKSALSIVSGDPNKRAMFDQANDFLAEDFGRKIGEIERFMEVSATFMDSVDLQNGVYEEDGLKLLEQWESSGSSLILGTDKTVLISQAQNPEEILDLDAVPVARKTPATSKYNKVFEEKGK